MTEAELETEPWFKAMERQDVVKELTIEQLRAHLALQGWYPVAATNEALQRDCERVYIIAYDRGLSVGYYVHSTPLARSEVEWSDIGDGRLRMLAKKIEGIL